MPWTYQVNSTFPFSTPPGGTRLEFHHLAPDRCLITRDGFLFDGPRAANYRDVLVLTDPAGIRRFYGQRKLSPGQASGGAESQTLEFLGPWDQLERITYHQSSTYKDATTGQLVSAVRLIPKAILNVGSTNLALTIGAVITAVIQYAIARGAPIALGVIDINTVLRASEVVAARCATIIRNQLVFAPDAVCWFDYSTSPFPTFHCRRRSALSAVTLSLAQSKIMADGYAIEGISSLVAHEDELCPCVALYYEITDTFNGTPYVRVEYDIDPPAADSLVADTITDVIGLQGRQVTTLEADLEIAALPFGAVQEKAFAQLLFPWLAGTEASAISIISITYDGDSVPVYDNYIVAGQPAGWMGIQWQEQVVTIRVAYDWSQTDGTTKMMTETNQPLSVRLKVTSEAPSAGLNLGQDNEGFRTYSTVTEDADGDPVPVGMAAALRSAMNTLEWSGSLLLTQQEATNLVTMGLGLNLTGTNDARHATMLALIKSLVIDIDTGQTAITIGPNAILSLDRRLEIIKANYFRRRSTSITQQQTGAPTSSSAIAFGSQGGSGNDTIHAPGSPSYLAVRSGSKSIIADASAPSHKLQDGASSSLTTPGREIHSMGSSVVDVNAADVTGTAKFRVTNICVLVGTTPTTYPVKLLRTGYPGEG